MTLPACLALVSPWTLLPGFALFSLGMVAVVFILLALWLLQHRRNLRLQASLHRINKLFHSVSDGLLSADRSGRAILANAATSRMLGMPPAELTGKSVHALLHENRVLHEDSDVISCGGLCQLRLALERCEATTCIETFYRPNGSSFDVELTVSPLQDKSGRVSGTALSFRDITQRQELEHLKDEFVSTVSHELRTPLTSIRGALGLLSAGLLGEMSSKASNLLRIAVANTDRLVRLINDLLDLERMASGRAPLHLRHSPLNDLILQSVETMTPMADAAGVKILTDNSAVHLDVDPDRIQQVLTNLLSNAIKFSPPGSLVEITQHVEDDTVLLKISDHGRGIPTDKLESIFERFQQIEASDARQKGGSGLGLAICRRIIQQHGGRIWASQNPLGGSVFQIVLPRTSHPASVVQHLTPATAGIHLKEGATVLVCDDDESLRSIVSAQLSLHGYNIVEAESGEQAIALATESGADVILLDLYMPGLSGWETLQRLRNNPATAQIPVVILSGLSPSERPGIAVTTAGWVQKPYNENLLLNELSRVLHNTEGPCRILLVEDDSDLAEILISSFEGSGITVDHALTRTAALHYFQHTRPDIVILDLTLPDGDGFGLVGWMRQQIDFRTLPLVVYSGHEVTTAERHQLVLGPTEFLTKARVQPQDVEALVVAMLRQFRDSNSPDSPNPDFRNPEAPYAETAHLQTVKPSDSAS